MRGLHRFKIRGKLAPRYIGPFKILEQRGEVAYQLELPPQLADVHDVFHVLQLRKCLRVPEEQMPLEELTVGEDLSVDVLRAAKSYEKLCGDILVVHLKKCMMGKMETLSHRRVMESPTCG
jgi:hypothetical protein